MSVRSKKAVLEMVAQHFEEFKLPRTTTQKEYMQIVGAEIAVGPRQIKRAWSRWTRLMTALNKHHPEVKKPEPKPAPKPAAAPKAAPAKSAPAPKPKAASVKKES